MSRFIRIILGLAIILILCGCNTTIANAYSVEYNGTSYTIDDLDNLTALVQEQEDLRQAAHQMAEGARALGYPEDHPIILLAKQEHLEASNLKKGYQSVYDNLKEHWQQKGKEYPTATYIWGYLKNLGYNDYVCAGVLGNIMAEVGGNTLNIQAMISGNGYYGMCQWNKAYSNIWGASLEEQCDYLRDTIEYEFNTFGYAYKRKFDYDSFLELTDMKDAALAFAKAYERCGSGSYYKRQQNAVIAYNYFIS